MSGTFYSLPRSSHSQEAPNLPDLSQNSKANQNDAIVFSSKFTSTGQNKPVSLAHFMGARRDLEGPVLTRQRIDEKEVRPEGWELAEKRSEMVSKQNSAGGGGVGSLANLLSGDMRPSHTISKHKRALPGMVPREVLEREQERYSTDLPHCPSPSGVVKLKPRSLPTPPSQALSSPSLASHSNAASFLKPKSLADRLAQLGVSSDVATTKTSQTSGHQMLPSAPSSSHFLSGKFSSTSNQAHSTETELQGSEKTVPLTSPLKSQSSHYMQVGSATQSSDCAKEPPKQSNSPSVRPLPSGLSPANIHNLPVAAEPARRPVSCCNNETSQVASTVDHNRRNLQIISLGAGQHNYDASCMQEKSLTASLSRLAGSNIVAQRLQWSKERQTMNTVNEFGNPKSCLAPNHSILSPVSSPQLNHTNCNEQKMVSPALRDGIHFKSTVGIVRPRHAHINSSNGTAQLSKSLHEHSNSLRCSSDEDEEPQASAHETKRSKLFMDRNHLPAATDCTEKSCLPDAKPRVDEAANISTHRRPWQPPPTKHSPKHRTRAPTRSLVANHSTGSHKRAELPPTPTNHPNSSLPSVDSFEPAMKKGASELAAVWEGHAAKQVVKPVPGELKPNFVRQLPAPPAPFIAASQPSHGDRESRPLPILPTQVGKVASGPFPNARPLRASLSKPKPNNGGDMTVREIIVEPIRRVPHVDTREIWASHEQICQRQAIVALTAEVSTLEILQLNRTQSEELCTTVIDREDYGTFYSQEMLLIIFGLAGKSKKTILTIWKGKDCVEEDESTMILKIERLLKKYAVETQSELMVVNQGYESIELVDALGGSLIIKEGDRFDSVYHERSNAVLSCKSFKTKEGNDVVLVEEKGLSPKNVTEGLCSGYCSLIKVCEVAISKVRVFIWKGRLASAAEVLECRALADKLRRQCTRLKVEVTEMSEGAECDEFLSRFGEGDLPRSYHWRYKLQLSNAPLILACSGRALSTLPKSEVSLIHNGLEIFIIVPSTCRSRRQDIYTAVIIGEGLSQESLKLNRRKLPANVLVFPTLIPIDLKAATRFSHDLDRLNEGFGDISTMNLVNLEEAKEGLIGDGEPVGQRVKQYLESELREERFLPIGVGPESAGSW